MRFYNVFMSSQQLLPLVLLLFTGGSIGESARYAEELEEAGTRIRSTFRHAEDLKSYKTQLFEYISKSSRGKSYFLHLLQLSHEILNEPEVKKVLEFLTENGVDVLKLFTINVPSTVYEAIKKEKDERRKEEDAPALLSFPSIHEFVDMEAAMEVGIGLLRENSAVKKLYSMLCKPALLLGVLKLVKAPIHKETFEQLGKAEGKGLPIARILEGLAKILSGQKDRRALADAERFIEGMGIILNCEQDPENEGCGVLKKGRLRDSAEL